MREGEVWSSKFYACDCIVKFVQNVLKMIKISKSNSDKENLIFECYNARKLMSGREIEIIVAEKHNWGYPNKKPAMMIAPDLLRIKGDSEYDFIRKRVTNVTLKNYQANPQKSIPAEVLMKKPVKLPPREKFSRTDARPTQGVPSGQRSKQDPSESHSSKQQAYVPEGQNLFDNPEIHTRPIFRKSGPNPTGKFFTGLKVTFIGSRRPQMSHHSSANSMGRYNNMGQHMGGPNMHGGNSNREPQMGVPGPEFAGNTFGNPIPG